MTTKDVVLKVQVQGNAATELKKVAGEGKKVTDTFAKSKGTKEVDALEKALRGANKGLVGMDVMLNKVNARFKQNSGAKVLADIIKQTEKATRAQEQLARSQERAAQKAKQQHGPSGDPLVGMAREAQYWADERARKLSAHGAHKAHNRHGFAMGVLQGAELGEYFPEHGLPANFAGRKVGGALRLGKEMSLTPFTGMEGFAQAAGGLPLIGGMIAAELGKAAGYVQQHQAAGRQKMGQMLYQAPGFAGHMGTAQGEAAARTAAASRVKIPTVTRPAILDQQQQADAEAQLASYGGGTVGGSTADLDRSTVVPGANRDEVNAYTAATARQEAAKKAAAARGEAAARAYRRKHEDAFDFMRRTGAELGMDPTAARESGGQFMGALGGTFDQIGPGGKQRELLETAYAAQTRYGVGMDTTAAFGRGGKTGAMGPGSGQDAFMSAMNQAIKLDLTGSDLTKYMEQMAGDIRSFETTGMPLAQESLASVQNSLVGAMGGVRASNVAKGVVSAAQNVAENGAGSAAEYMMLQDMGGYKGGGIKEYYQAQKALRKGGIAGGLDKLLQRARIYGSTEGNVLGMQGLLKQYGVSVNEDELEAYELGDKSKSAGWQQSITAGGMMSEAKAGTPGGLKRAAEEAATKEGIGSRMEKMVQDLEAASTATSHNFSKFGSQLGGLTGKIEHFAKDAGPFFDSVVKFIDDVRARLP